MMTVFALSHTAMLLAFGTARGYGAGPLLFLVALTQFNDVAQFTWGKLFGRHKILPSVSPKKTWEGFLGGFVTSVAVAGLVGPYLTPMNMHWSLLAGAIIAIAGFLGDVTLSATKRDLGVKDASNLIPGHGGILDRVDSLIYAAPVFFHFINYFYGHTAP
jgi:phosphatidate cytidylyltransferase